MNEQLVDLTYTLELAAGERLTLPQDMIEKVGPGRWIVTVRQCTGPVASPSVRRHDAFLSGYAPADEGLYDDLPR